MTKQSTVGPLLTPQNTDFKAAFVSTSTPANKKLPKLSTTNIQVFTAHIAPLESARSIV